MFCQLLRKTSRSMLGVFIVLAAGASFAQGAVSVVLSNNVGGDSFTNPTNGGPDLSQPVGATGWVYSNVRFGGTVGIDSAEPNGGNGSVHFSGLIGPSGSAPGFKTSKADIEYFTGSPLGTLDNLSAFSYQWIRLAGGTANGWLHPNLRVFVQNPSNPSVAGYLVFERTYNSGFGLNDAPVGAWQTDDVLGSDYNVYSTGSLPNAFAKFDRKLSQWKSLIGGYNVLAFSSGIGSGWGSFEGAVDQITFGFNGVSTTTNFEVRPAVPEPASLGLVGAGAVALLARRRRR